VSLFLLEERFLVANRQSEDADDNSVDIELTGNTLSIYWFMYRFNEPFSAREIQRQLGLSSSSVSLHHLNKLIDLGFVSTDEHGRYILKHKEKLGQMNMFVGFGRLFIPRLAVYASVCSGFFISYLLILWQFMTPATSLFFVSHLLITIALWFESIKVWNLQPF
jgi:hypothetical protein